MKKRLILLLGILASASIMSMPTFSQESEYERIERLHYEASYIYPEIDCMLNIDLFPNGFFVHYSKQHKPKRVLPNPDWIKHKKMPLCCWEYLNYNILDSAKAHNYIIVNNAPEAVNQILRNPKAKIVVVQERPAPINRERNY